MLNNQQFEIFNNFLEFISIASLIIMLSGALLTSNTRKVFKDDWISIVKHSKGMQLMLI